MCATEQERDCILALCQDGTGAEVCALHFPRSRRHRRALAAKDRRRSQAGDDEAQTDLAERSGGEAPAATAIARDSACGAANDKCVLPLLNFEWVAGQGEVRENPNAAGFCDQPSQLGVGPWKRRSSPLHPAATRMNAGFSPFRTNKTRRSGPCFVARFLASFLSDRAKTGRNPPTQISTEPQSACSSSSVSLPKLKKDWRN